MEELNIEDHVKIISGESFRHFSQKLVWKVINISGDFVSLESIYDNYHYYHPYTTTVNKNNCSKLSS